MNPIRGKIVKDLNELERYPYCGHSALMGKKKREWQDTEYVLKYFGKRVGTSRKKYEDYVKDYMTGKGRQNDRVKARNLVCYWCSVKIGMPMSELSRKLGLTLATVSYAVRRGEEIAKDNKFTLVD